MNIFEIFWYMISGYVPKRYGKRVKEGIWYDTYYSKESNKNWAFEKTTGKFFEREL